jgi:hypothetical protein
MASTSWGTEALTLGSLMMLGGRELLREGGDDAAGEGDVAGFHGDAGVLGESLDDRQEGIGGERRGLVSLGVNDGGGGGHKRRKEQGTRVES